MFTLEAKQMSKGNCRIRRTRYRANGLRPILAIAAAALTSEAESAVWQLFVHYTLKRTKGLKQGSTRAKAFAQTSQEIFLHKRQTVLTTPPRKALAS